MILHQVFQVLPVVCHKDLFWGPSYFYYTLMIFIKHCKVHHFADDTTLLIINKSPKRLNKIINIDLIFTNWLNVNKIWLNVSKTELIIHKPKIKFLLNLNEKKLYSTDSVKYLGVTTDRKLNWKSYFIAIATKLNRASGMLCIVWDFISANILKPIYYALFELHINYACIIWGQTINTVNRFYILQKKALGTINFKQ